MKTKKKLYAILVTLLCTLMLGMTAQAASTVAKIGSKKYTSLEKAFKAVKSGQTIKLQKNITVKSNTKPIDLKRNVKITLDLSKHAIKHSGAANIVEKGAGYIRVRKGSLTVKNGKAMVPFSVYKGAKLTMQSGTYLQLVNYGGTLTVKGSTISTSDLSGIIATGGKTTISKAKVKSGKNCVYVKNADVAIQSGTFQAEKKGTFPVVAVEKGGKVTISGGTFTSDNTSTVMNLGGTLTVNGGKFTGNGDYVTIYNASKGKTVINNGTIVSKKTNAIKNSASLTIRGGAIYGKGINYPTVFCDKSSKTTISNGTITSKSNLAVQNEGTMKVSGGTFESYYEVFYCTDDSQTTFTGGTIRTTYQHDITYGIIAQDDIDTGMTKLVLKKGVKFENKDNVSENKNIYIDVSAFGGIDFPREGLEIDPSYEPLVTPRDYHYWIFGCTHEW